MKTFYISLLVFIFIVVPIFKTMIKADTNSHKLTNIQLEIKELREVQNGK
jgi:hypothetical protein